ncbi:MAG: hypothetical protein NUV65_05770 [Candidatus Roizmanbacteria bacterium]|nr:hypothetical protein [Candidatus Roizmanbacteria bacterium]
MPTYKDLGYNGFLSKSITSRISYSSVDAKNMFPRSSFSSAAISTPLNATTNIVFSSTDNNTAAWTAGAITFSNGQTSGTLGAGSTGNIAATTYVYYDREILGELQMTTTASNATGLSKFLVAVIEIGETGKDCQITPFIGAGLHVTNITAEQVSADAVFTAFLGVGALSFVSTLVWTATDYNTATWATGSIKFADGTIYSITGSNTGNIVAKTYVYLDTDVSITALQATTTYSTAIGGNKTLIAVVELGVSGAGCIISVMHAEGTTIDGDRIVTGKIESADGKTYFDLDNNYIIMNDGTSNRVVIGDV